MFTNLLDGLKGFNRGSPWVVDKVLTKNSGESNAIKAGTVLYQYNATTWKVGQPAVTTTYAPVPFLAIQNDTDFDVVGDDGNIVGANSSGTQLANISAVSCAQHAEFESTCYDTGVTSTLYTPGKLLTSNGSGKPTLFSGTGTAVILGVVSDGVVTTARSRAVTALRFHSVYAIKFS